MDFKNSLRKHISEKDITRKDLEKKAGLPPRALEPYLDRDSKPNIDIAKKLADALGVSLDNFYDFDFSGYEISDELINLVKLLQILDAEDFYTVSTLIGLLSRKEKYVKEMLQIPEFSEVVKNEKRTIGDEKSVGLKKKQTVKNRANNTDTVGVKKLMK